MTAEWYSEALGRPTRVHALLPSAMVSGAHPPEYRYKTVYLIPGALSGSEALFVETDLASSYDGVTPEDVVIISVTPTFSFCTNYQKDYRYAHQYYTYVTREVLEISRALFPLSHRREDTAIYGFSAGGWGSFYCGLNNPQTYGYVGAQSGMLDAQWAVDNRHFMKVKHQRQYGDGMQIKDTQFDLYAITESLDRRAAAGDPMVPKLFQSWGGEADYLNTPNIHMHEHLSKLEHLDYTCYEGHWIHSWGPHNEGLNRFLDWFLKKERKGGEA